MKYQTQDKSNMNFENKKTAMQELRNDIIIEFKLGYISEHSATRIFGYIDALYLEQEKRQMLSLIHFVRLNDKMGKSIEDLYNEFYETI